ncbi:MULTISPECIES: thioredoxin [Galbibacter]|uniref:Thioredoxin n=1 Tax=Galbibacter pacificus TaxID=2996052 RepID=A0ABT6FQP4_9FLAO|nr:thioredoxin [Galbibacter pacificus]MDG3582082.1 thioredoxin [Galbibacter pacificus]MDG3585442.1 thioredoxin [Galbibacter pacificus]
MQSSFKDIINVNKPVLIDFYADWCGPCQTMMPILTEVKESLGEHINIIKINVDKNKELASKFQVRGVPTFMVFKNGASVWRGSGVVSKNDLIKLLKSYV